jgi:hypothetical protein
MPEQRPPRNYEAEFSYILHSHGRTELSLWVLKYGTENEQVWWWSRFLESETGEKITNALDIAALGENEALAIRVAGHRLIRKIVKAFLGTKPQLQKSHNLTCF